MNSLACSHCCAPEDNNLTSHSMFFSASRISKKHCADLHVLAKKGNEMKHKPSHFNRASCLLRFIICKNELHDWKTLKVNCNGWEKTTEPGMGGVGKKPCFYGFGFILYNNFYKSFTQTLNKDLSHVCIFNEFNPSEKCLLPNAVESCLSAVVPEMQNKKNPTPRPFQFPERIICIRLSNSEQLKQ